MGMKPGFTESDDAASRAGGYRHSFTWFGAGALAGYLPVIYLALLNQAGFRPFIPAFVVYCGLCVPLYLAFRHRPWAALGNLFCMVNLLLLFLISDEPLWAILFGPSLPFMSMAIYHLPAVTYSQILLEGPVRAPRHSEPVTDKLDLLKDVLGLWVPWTCLGLMKLAGLKPFGPALALYLAVLLAMGSHYVRRRMIPSLINYDPPATAAGCCSFVRGCTSAVFFCSIG